MGIVVNISILWIEKTISSDVGTHVDVISSLRYAFFVAAVPEHLVIGIVFLVIWGWRGRSLHQRAPATAAFTLVLVVTLGRIVGENGS